MECSGRMPGLTLQRFSEPLRTGVPHYMKVITSPPRTLSPPVCVADTGVVISVS